MTRRAILLCALAAAGADCFLSPAGGLRAPAVRLRSAAMPLRMTVNEWVKAVDPISEQEYYYNPLTLESSWERPADMEAASDVRAPPPEAGTRSDSLWEQGVAGSKQQQLAKILQNQETRARARAEKQALEQEQRAAAAAADKAAREARAALVANGSKNSAPQFQQDGLTPKNAILAMSSARTGGRDDETPGFLAVLNPLKPGVVWYKEPSLVLFFGAKIGLILYAVFVGFHNQYTGDFGPFISIHDGQVDFGAAASEWQRLHTNQFAKQTSPP